MTQRNTTSQIAIAQPQGQADALLVAPLALITALTTALITVLVLITGPLSAEYGFA